MEYLVRLIGRRLERKEGRIPVSIGWSVVCWALGMGMEYGLVWIGMVWIGMVFFTPGRAKVYQT